MSNASLASWVAAFVGLSSCVSGPSVLERRGRLRQARATAHRAPGTPDVELVRSAGSEWPFDASKPCVPVLRAAPSSLEPAAEMEVLSGPGVTTEAMADLLSTVACTEGFAGVVLGTPKRRPDGRVERIASLMRPISGLEVEMADFVRRPEPMPGACDVPLLRLAPQRPYREMATLTYATSLELEEARKVLTAEACALGADALLVIQERNSASMYSHGPWGPMFVVQDARMQAVALSYASPSRPKPVDVNERPVFGI